MTIFYLSKAISRKRCKIWGGKLLLITNRKSRMSFRLAPESVTLNDLERRNSCNLCALSPNSVAFGTGWKYTETFCVRNVGQRIQFFVIYHLRRYWQGITPSESVKVRHSPLASENLTVSPTRPLILQEGLKMRNLTPIFDYSPV